MLVKNMVIKIQVKYWIVVGFAYLITRLIFGINLTLTELTMSLLAYVWGAINLNPIILKKDFHQPYSNIRLTRGIDSGARFCHFLIYLPIFLVGLFSPEFMELIGE